ncbi:MAG: hypothetical protein ACRD93_04760 [Nitrososphaeraceae archaeon]
MTVVIDSKTQEQIDDETREYHRKKLLELSKNLEFVVPQLDEPSEEEKEWVNRRMRGSAGSWERWFVGHYFTEEQKKELGLTDEDIAGKGMKE